MLNDNTWGDLCSTKQKGFGIRNRDRERGGGGLVLEREKGKKGGRKYIIIRGDLVAKGEGI